jgi:hypothetical protein
VNVDAAILTYYTDFTDNDIEEINLEKINLLLVYEGKCEKSEAFALSLTAVEK